MFVSGGSDGEESSFCLLMERNHAAVSRIVSVWEIKSRWKKKVNVNLGNYHKNVYCWVGALECIFANYFYNSFEGVWENFKVLSFVKNELLHKWF